MILRAAARSALISTWLLSATISRMRAYSRRAAMVLTATSGAPKAGTPFSTSQRMASADFSPPTKETVTGLVVQPDSSMACLMPLAISTGSVMAVSQ